MTASQAEKTVVYLSVGSIRDPFNEIRTEIVPTSKNSKLKSKRTLFPKRFFLVAGFLRRCRLFFFTVAPTSEELPPPLRNGPWTPFYRERGGAVALSHLQWRQ